MHKVEDSIIHQAFAKTDLAVSVQRMMVAILEARMKAWREKDHNDDDESDMEMVEDETDYEVVAISSTECEKAQIFSVSSESEPDLLA